MREAVKAQTVPANIYGRLVLEIAYLKALTPDTSPAYAVAGRAEDYPEMSRCGEPAHRDLRSTDAAGQEHGFRIACSDDESAYTGRFGSLCNSRTLINR